ncbi:AAA family ATPase [Algibacter lectus]|uniref:AAA family ATPase n=1 Tax=Algibacter lectus TaxID=221126 RepID=UPI0026ECDEA7|nr:AAA family ATPase [Algibacter lectus]MDO7136339.1 AAA family ATPase [Algibacter lectus]
MSTTNTQRELIDFLWDWTNPLGSWSKLLVELIINKQEVLDVNERNRVFDYFIQDIGFTHNTSLPPLIITKPRFTLPSKEIILTKLSEVKGVNKLAENQVMDFSPNITVIYGNNGVGKTGYSRVLKSQGYSFDNNISILSNVHKSQVKQSARLDFNSNGSAFHLDWQGVRTESDLNTISVFNSDCVNVSLSNTRELLVAPKGFYLFTLVTNELTELMKSLKFQYQLYPILLQWKDQLNIETPQNKFVDALTHSSDKNLLNELSLFTEKHQTALTTKEEKLKDLNKAALETNLNSYNLMLTELDSVISDVKKTKSHLTKTNWDTIIYYNTTLKNLKAKTQLGIAGLAAENGLEQFNTDVFSEFLKSAELYIKLLAKVNYPNNEDDTCVYCKQDLQNEKAKKLVESYSKILNDTTETQISKYEKLKSDIIKQISLITENIVFHHPIFGVLEDGRIFQPQEITEFNARVLLFKTHVIKNTVKANLPFDINYFGIIQFLELKQSDFANSRNAIIKLLANLTETEAKLKTEIAELKDRKLLSINKQNVLTTITNLLARKLLDDNKSQFNTSSLSIKTTQAREELIAQDFQHKFTNELKLFRKNHLNVNLSFFSQQGGSRIRQNVANHDINKVLSEGEQKTIALCEFLTELQLDAVIAPVVFDDPVNSLDHLIIQDVANRLVDLSKERQVILFTHNVIFYNAFFTQQKNTLNKGVDFRFYNVSTNGVNTGILSDGKPINKLSTYKGKLNIIFNNGLDGRNENEVAAEGYAYLRTSLELLVSNTIFQEIVGRYRNNIMMTKFPAVKGDKIEKYKAEIDAMFVRSSGYISAHSHPEEQNVAPTLNDLKADFERFQLIEADFR